MKFLRPTHHRLHWRLDVVMNEDRQRNRSDNGRGSNLGYTRLLVDRAGIDDAT